MPKEREDRGDPGNGNREQSKNLNAEEVIKILGDLGSSDVEIHEGREENPPRRWIFTVKHEAPTSLRSEQLFDMISRSKTLPDD